MGPRLPNTGIVRMMILGLTDLHLSRKAALHYKDILYYSTNFIFAPKPYINIYYCTSRELLSTYEGGGGEGNLSQAVTLCSFRLFWSGIGIYSNKCRTIVAATEQLKAEQEKLYKIYHGWIRLRGLFRIWNRWKDPGNVFK